MQIIPAIDIKDGVCVRLYQGDFNQTTVYGTDVVAMAQQWVSQGASRLHIVDLDGAKTGKPVNHAAIAAIARAVHVPVQVGGGLRTADDITSLLSVGVSNVIMGTAAVEQPALIQRMVEQFGERIIVGVDARDGYVATAGWLDVAPVRATDLVAHMATLGVTTVVYTDISRDGTMTEPNYEATAELVHMGTIAIIASGGIAHQEQLIKLAHSGVAGAIVGKALYTGAISLPEALTAVATATR